MTDRQNKSFIYRSRSSMAWKGRFLWEGWCRPAFSISRCFSVRILLGGVPGLLALFLLAAGECVAVRRGDRGRNTSSMRGSSRLQSGRRWCTSRTSCPSADSATGSLSLTRGNWCSPAAMMSWPGIWRGRCAVVGDIGTILPLISTTFYRWRQDNSKKN